MYIKTLDKEHLTAFFTTEKGASESPYMNENVRKALGLSEVPWVRTRQVHEDRIAYIGSVPSEDIVLEGYDALVTDQKGVCLATVHADCTPVQLYDEKAGVIAAVHAGWRGTALGIAGKTARILKEDYGCENLCAYIGPAISLCCFEVGSEVTEAFSEYPQAIRSFGEKDHVDLKAINRIQLEREGVRDIAVSDICTFCDTRFISYRREKGTLLRMASGICMNK